MLMGNDLVENMIPSPPLPLEAVYWVLIGSVVLALYAWFVRRTLRASREFIIQQRQTLTSKATTLGITVHDSDSNYLLQKKVQAAELAIAQDEALTKRRRTPR